MFFSIIIPLYNKEKYIMNTLASIYQQTFHDYEVIIIDDFSSDSSLKVADNYLNSIRSNKFCLYKNSDNMGVSYTRNKGIKISNGQYIMFLDADDEICDNNLFRNLNSIFLEFNPEYISLSRNYFNKFVKPEYDRIKDDILFLAPSIYKITNKRQYIIDGNYPFGGSASAVISRDILLDKKFPETESKFEDWMFFINIFIESKLSIYFSETSILINDDINSLSVRNISKSPKLPELYNYLNSDIYLITNRKHFFWLWLKNSLNHQYSVKSAIVFIFKHLKLIIDNSSMDAITLKNYFILVAKIMKIRSGIKKNSHI